MKWNSVSFEALCCTSVIEVSWKEANMIAIMADAKLQNAITCSRHGRQQLVGFVSICWQQRNILLGVSDRVNTLLAKCEEMPAGLRSFGTDLAT